MHRYRFILNIRFAILCSFLCANVLCAPVGSGIAWCQDSFDGRENRNSSGELSVEKVRAHFRKVKSEQAARWLLANAFPQPKWKSLRSSERKDLEEVLFAIPNKSPEDAQFKVAYAELLATKKLEQQAVPFLLAATDVYPNVGIHAAKILRKFGEEERAIEVAKETLTAFEKLHKEEPDETSHTTGLASAYLFLHQNTDALMTLINASKVSKGKENTFRLNQAIGETIVVWIVALEKDEIDPSNPAANHQDNIWKMLDSAVDVAPNNAPVINEVRKQLMKLAKKEDAEIRESRDTLFAGTQPGYFEMIRGIAALINEDEGRAGQNLVRAIDLSPKLTDVIKNLAIAFGSTYNDIVGNKEVLELGLKLANVALKKTSEPTPSYFETRGQLLYRLKRYEEAIPDLEKGAEDPARQESMEQLLETCRIYVQD